MPSRDPAVKHPIKKLPPTITHSPTVTPTMTPSQAPSFAPSDSPTQTPTFSPSDQRLFSTLTPSAPPSFLPSTVPSAYPSFPPTFAPTDAPTFTPALQRQCPLLRHRACFSKWADKPWLSTSPIECQRQCAEHSRAGTTVWNFGGCEWDEQGRAQTFFHRNLGACRRRMPTACHRLEET